MAETASATIANSQLDPSTFQYSLKLNDTGDTTVGTFWFSWVPGEDFMAVAPAAIIDPAGWQHVVTGGFPGDGFAIQWTAISPSAEIQPGGSLTGFSFQSSSTPAQMSGNSVFFPSTPVLTAFVYQAAPLADPGFQFVVSPACFREGTRLRTSRGEVAVEALLPDDRLMTLEGSYRPLKWLGRRRIDCARHRSAAQVWPVRIVRDAVAPGQPDRDLYLSPDHAIYFDHILVPARCLVNGTTIAQVPVDEVVYFHIEMDRHDVLLAEGLPAESYLDTGDRSTFENGGGAIALHPDFAMRTWESRGYAPLVVDGPALAPIQRRLREQAGRLEQRSRAAG